MDQEDRPRDLIDHVLRSCPMLKRSSWKPEVRPGDEKDSRHCTKFGGNKPFRPDNFKWPVCSGCRTHKAFVCQINIADLPPLLKEHIKMTSGLFQLFYCHECLPNRPTSCFEDISFIDRSELVLSLQSLAAEKVGGLKGYNSKALPPILRNFVQDYTEEVPLRKYDEMYYDFYGNNDEKHTIEETVVKGWKIHSEMPSHEEICNSDSGIAQEIKRKANFTEEQYQSFIDQIGDGSLYCLTDSDSGGMIEVGVKLGGWIYWWEGHRGGPSPTPRGSYIECPDCRVSMDITFLQMEEDDDVYKFHWGGCWLHGGHAPYGYVGVMICPKCKRPGLQRL